MHDLKLERFYPVGKTYNDRVIVPDGPIRDFYVTIRKPCSCNTNWMAARTTLVAVSHHLDMAGQLQAKMTAGAGD